jgi:hypothetical protein
MRRGKSGAARAIVHYLGGVALQTLVRLLKVAFGDLGTMTYAQKLDFRSTRNSVVAKIVFMTT